MSPTFTIGRHGKRYLYNASTSLQQAQRKTEDGFIGRVPAPVIEKTIGDKVGQLDRRDHATPFWGLKKVEIYRHRIVLTLPASFKPSLRRTLSQEEHGEEHPADLQLVCATLPPDLFERGGD